MHLLLMSSPRLQKQMACKTIFVVSDDAAIRDSLAELAASAGLHAETFSSLETWLEAIQPVQRGCIVLDAQVCEFADPERLAQFACLCAKRSVLLLINRGDVPTAVRAIKCGAMHVVEKPYRDANLLEKIKCAISAAQDMTRRDKQDHPPA